MTSKPASFNFSSHFFFSNSFGTVSILSSGFPFGFFSNSANAFGESCAFRSLTIFSSVMSGSLRSARSVSSLIASTKALYSGSYFSLFAICRIIFFAAIADLNGLFPRCGLIISTAFCASAFDLIVSSSRLRKSFDISIPSVFRKASSSFLGARKSLKNVFRFVPAFLESPVLTSLMKSLLMMLADSFFITSAGRLRIFSIVSMVGFSSLCSSRKSRVSVSSFLTSFSSFLTMISLNLSFSEVSSSSACFFVSRFSMSALKSFSFIVSKTIARACAGSLLNTVLSLIFLTIISVTSFMPSAAFRVAVSPPGVSISI